MKKNKISLYLIGVLNGILFAFAFLFFIVRMDEVFHFIDSEEEPSKVGSIACMDLALYNIEDIEKEYFKRCSPEKILDILLHHYSMKGTIWEEKWDSISDIEKVAILLDDTLQDRYKYKKKRKIIGSKAIYSLKKENNNPSQGTFGKDSQTTIYSFFGKPIIINDSLCEQIVSIAGQDEMLSYNDSIIKIGEVWWRLNLMPNSIALMTSVQPDDPKMKHVIKYLNGIYGKPYDDHEDGYSIKWSSSGDSLDVFRPGSTLVHLRRVHTEEGGTFLIFK